MPQEVSSQRVPCTERLSPRPHEDGGPVEVKPCALLQQRPLAVFLAHGRALCLGTQPLCRPWHFPGSWLDPRNVIPWRLHRGTLVDALR